LSNFECNTESYSQNIEYDLNLKGQVTLVPSLKNSYPKSEQILKVAQTTVNINNKRLSDFLISLESEIDAEFVHNQDNKSKF